MNQGLVVKILKLVIPHQSTQRGELGLLDDGEREILRCAQDDNPSAILSAAKDLFRTDG